MSLMSAFLIGVGIVIGCRIIGSCMEEGLLGIGKSIEKATNRYIRHTINKVERP